MIFDVRRFEDARSQYNAKHMHCTHIPSAYTHFHRFLFLITTISSLLFIGCSSQPEMDTDIEETEALYFEVIGQGASSQFTDTTQVVLKDQQAWEDYQQYMKTVIPFPEIDFSQLMVVVVAVPVPMLGISIQIQSIERINEDVVVNYQMGIPGSDCRGNDNPTTPFQVVMLPQATGNFQFESTTDEYQCTL